MAEVEAGSEDTWSAPVYGAAAVHARDHHPAAAAPPRADGPVWHRFGRRGWHTLTDALAKPDGDELPAVEQAEADRARPSREAAERERRRAVCIRCSARFSDGR